MNTTALRLAGAAAACALMCAPALAQKAKDTLRVGAFQPISIVDTFYDPQPHTNLMDRIVFDMLVRYDVDGNMTGGECRPELAAPAACAADRTAP